MPCMNAVSIAKLGLQTSCVSVCLSMFVALSARADDVCDDVHVPAKAEAFGTPLVLNGMGVRRATLFNVHVYVAGLYLEQRTQKVAEALQPAHAKRLELHFVRDVSRSEMLDAMQKGLEKNAGPSSLPAARKHMQNFEKFLPDLRKGTVLSLAFGVGHGLEVRANAKLLGVESNDDFANLVFAIWLGEHPPDTKLKAGLLGAKCD
jgi:hypothetical protein